MRLVRLSGAALALVALGRLLSPAAVPVYDGIGIPDEPYRYVAPPAGVARTAAPTTGSWSSPVAAGLTTGGFSVSSSEVSPQVSIFIPPKALATKGTSVTVTATPLAATEQPKGARVDGNVYAVAFVSTSPVTVAPGMSFAQISLRATSPQQPGPTMWHRPGPGSAWTRLPTTRVGTDTYTATFHDPGQYALAFPTASASHGSFPVPLLLLGGLVLLVVLVVVVRVRAAE